MSAIQSKPLLVTMGDPAGVGPELIWRLWRHDECRSAPWCVVGHEASLRRAAAFVGESPQRLCVIAHDAWSRGLPQTLAPDALTLLALDEADDLAPLGEVSAWAGRLAARSIEAAAHLCLNARAAAMVTAPIHKQALALAGWAVPGHTEMLQQLAAKDRGVATAQLPVRMMLANAELQVVLHSIHLSLRDALEAITPETLWQTVCLTQRHVRRLDGSLQPLRIAVAGVNPHAGEGGRFGRQEIDLIAPVLARARAQGWAVSGPWSPDTVFMRARAGEFDAVVAMYHDQGLIPVKYLGLDDGVNVTLGLPFVRSSPDHGTAMDLAGSGRARVDSLAAAWRFATRASGA